jgi:kinesin family protein C2/C3|tara:strand:- start:25 stop:273 length:249 start_codon:yes stop_codon:yes gene_type:complete
MFVNISPVSWCASESLCSLKFAKRCSDVALGAATKKEDSALVAKLRRENAELRRKVGSSGGGSRSGTPVKGVDGGAAGEEET